MTADLPEGWVLVELGEACWKVQDGTHFSPKAQHRNGAYKYITAKNIKTWGIDLQDVTYIAEDVHRSIYARCNPEKGDVLYIKDGATTGIATVNTLDEEFSLLSSVALLKPMRGLIDAEYLKWYLNSPSGFEAMTGQMTGSAITRLILRTIRESRMPLAPFAEQQRIVRRLGHLLPKANRCQQRLATIGIILMRFREAVLAAACDGQLTADWRAGRDIGLGAVHAEMDSIPPGWSSVCVGDVIDDLKYGTAQKCTHEKRGTPVLRIPNVANGMIDHNDLKYAVLPPRELKSLRLISGDILIIRSNGSVSLVGRSALVRKEEEGFAYAGYLIRIRPQRTAIDPRFLNLVLGSYNIRIQIELEARSTSGVNNINSEEVRALRFLLPKLDEQKEILRRVEEMFKLADRLEARYEKAKVQVDKLTQAFLAKAFRGELVPTEAALAKAEGRSYETAEQLLARIQNERAQPGRNGVARRVGPVNGARRRKTLDRSGKRRG